MLYTSLPDTGEKKSIASVRISLKLVHALRKSSEEGEFKSPSSAASLARAVISWGSSQVCERIVA